MGCWDMDFNLIIYIISSCNDDTQILARHPIILQAQRQCSPLSTPIMILNIGLILRNLDDLNACRSGASSTF